VLAALNLYRKRPHREKAPGLVLSLTPTLNPVPIVYPPRPAKPLLGVSVI
jgi:hypothetical protein